MGIAPETLYYEVAGVPEPNMLREAPPEYGRKSGQQLWAPPVLLPQILNVHRGQFSMTFRVCSGLCCMRMRQASSSGAMVRMLAGSRSAHQAAGG